MKLSDNRFICMSSRYMVAGIVAITLAFAPGMSFAADKDAHEDHAELRIKDMHSKLKISAEQEALWAKVAQAMLDDAKTMDSLTQARLDHAKEMTAIDDLKSYSEIADAHAAGIKNLLPVFTELYTSMSDAQKKEADALFRNPMYKKALKHSHKKSVKK